MGQIIPFRIPEILDFEGVALVKMLHVAQVARLVPKLLEDPSIGESVQRQFGVRVLCDCLFLIDDMLEWLESLAPRITDLMIPHQHEIFELECHLTKMRVSVLASARNSRLFVSDLMIEDLDSALCA